MIALDTNVLIRLLVKDDAAQTKRALNLIKRAERAGERLYLPDVVVCETVWVLDAVYGFSRDRITDVLEQVLSARQLAFHAADRLHRAVRAYQEGPGDLADYVIREDARSAGCEAVATFDKALLKEELFTGL